MTQLTLPCRGVAAAAAAALPAVRIGFRTVSGTGAVLLQLPHMHVLAQVIMHLRSGQRVLYQGIVK
jgi:hypothetical protein